MIKSELVQRIAAQNPHLYQRDVENIVNAILGEITAAMSKGDRVELRGFGAFSVKNRPARTGRNPRTGAHVSVEQKSVPFFKTGKEMRERLNKPAARCSAAWFICLRTVLLSWPGLVPAICCLWRSRHAKVHVRKIVTAVIVIPLVVVIVAFAVANRQTVTVSFDPFSQAAPGLRGDAAAVRGHLRGADRRRADRRHCRLAAPGQVAAHGAASRCRRAQRCMASWRPSAAASGLPRPADGAGPAAGHSAANSLTPPMVCALRRRGEGGRTRPLWL